MGKDRKFNKTPEWLYEHYVTKNESLQDVAMQCNLSRAGLKSTLLKYKIKKEKKIVDVVKLKELLQRGKSVEEISKELGNSTTSIYRTMAKNKLSINYKPDFSQYDDSKDFIICSLYLDGFSSVEISKRIGLSHSTVLKHLKHCNISRRTLSESQFSKNNKEYPKEFSDYKIMYNLYITQKLSKKDLGEKFNVDPGVIDKVLKDLKIPIRTNSQSKIGLRTGENHPNWQGGITSLHMRLREAFFVQQVPKILKRDHYTCQMCGSKKHLHVHHINSFSSILHTILEEHPDLDPIKDINKLYDIAINDSRFTDESNLITYCKDCHFYKIHKYRKTLFAETHEMCEK